MIHKEFVNSGAMTLTNYRNLSYVTCVIHTHTHMISIYVFQNHYLKVFLKHKILKNLLFYLDIEL